MTTDTTNAGEPPMTATTYRDNRGPQPTSAECADRAAEIRTAQLAAIVRGDRETVIDLNPLRKHAMLDAEWLASVGL